jgi:hypothetical protein
VQGIAAGLSCSPLLFRLTVEIADKDKGLCEGGKMCHMLRQPAHEPLFTRSGQISGRVPAARER